MGAPGGSRLDTQVYQIEKVYYTGALRGSESEN
jgi:hypothetical protein